jgi:hypothetical protein
MAAVRANKYPTKIGCMNIGNRVAEIKRPKRDNQFFLRVLILAHVSFFTKVIIKIYAL